MKDLVIFVENDEKIVRISEGNGCNLTTEDIDEGYVDYLYYDIFDAQDLENIEDGGMVLLKKPIKDEFNVVSEIEARVLAMAGYVHKPSTYILSGANDWYALFIKKED